MVAVVVAITVTVDDDGLAKKVVENGFSAANDTA